MATWETPKTNWLPTDAIADSDLNRIEGNTEYVYDGIQSWLNFQQFGGTITGNVTISGTLNVSSNITTTSGSFILSNNKTLQGKRTDGALNNLIGIDTSNVLVIGAGVSNATISPTLTCSSSVTINSTLYVKGGTVRVGKSGTNSYINFDAQTNDPGFILHYENNNSSYMQFNVSDDASDNDYFRFTVTPSGNTTDLMRIFGNGIINVKGPIRSTDISGSTGGIYLSSGGGANRRFFIGASQDWNGGVPPGATYGDIWIEP